MLDFISVLNDTVDSSFPNIERRIVNGGDYIDDFVIELRKDDKMFRYVPYALYSQSEDYEETINNFVEKLKNIFL